jgi:UDP:flavonoid glycosyltransferase YjiC (YdhE family)
MNLIYPIAVKPIYSIFWALYSLPFNRVLHDYGLSSLEFDIRYIITAGDHVLYADIPELVPTRELPATHQYVGPILWSPAIPLPSWWNEIPEDKPIIYITLGSSGPQQLLPMILDELAKLPVSIVAATAGRAKLNSTPANVFVSDYLPGQEAAARASLVICNGGSPTTYQALAAGKPVIGIANNIDQYLNIQGICSSGAAILIRSDGVEPLRLSRAVTNILSQPGYTQAAQRVAKIITSYDAIARFNEVIGRYA